VIAETTIEALLRELAPHVLSALVRRYGHFDACEDAVQEALLAAALQWNVDGVPDNPRSWLVAVAARRLFDVWRSDSARQRREASTAPREDASQADTGSDHDDALTLLFLCCHPALSAPSQLALTLRAVGGLTTAEIASAFLVPEPTMGQRISRAKQTIKQAGAHFDLPSEAERAGRLAVVEQVLYLMFNEGYTASSGVVGQRTDLTSEAIRLARLLHHLLPDDGEVAGLLALMLFTDARRLARMDADGLPIPLAEQRRELWNRGQVAEGVALLTRTLGAGPVGPYQLQAAIAAVHDEARSDADTDWAEILALYGVLERIAPSPVVTLNRAVALARVDGPQAGLAVLDVLGRDPRIRGYHRLHAVRANLLERVGDLVEARQEYLQAARMTTSVPEQRYLALQAGRLAAISEPGREPPAAPAPPPRPRRELRPGPAAQPPTAPARGRHPRTDTSAHSQSPDESG
jgi:RNA polymerase sigma factor (sigma-70 family)